ncbi:MAG: ATP-dependent Clp protease proteolytic subunit [Planctomycetes bacterium]|nr:ATP-dependent Clp protease proteolytic subunit [Planctomycetota bacterium]
MNVIGVKTASQWGVAMRPVQRFTLLTLIRFVIALVMASIHLPFVCAQADRGEALIEGAPKSSVSAGAILTLHGEITDVTVESIKRRIEAAKAAGAKLIVLDMDTPGGMVTSSIAIADAIRSLTDVKTIAWVNPNALSGGSLIAVACNEIVMSRSSRIGDSQVIFGDFTGVQAVPKELQPKAYTPVVHDFRTSARKNGYSEVLAEAFVIPEREVWWIENTATGAREFVFTEEKEKRLKSDSASDLAPTSWKLVDHYFDPIAKTDVPVRQPIESGSELLAMSPSEATAYGFCKAVISSESELRDRYHLATLTRFTPSGLESLAYWLTSTYVRGFLLIIIFLGVYTEFHAPGVSLPGLVALIALVIFVGAPYLTGLANIWEILLIVVGLLLIGLEIFVIPGFGVAGISGFLLLVVGLVATFVPDEPGRSFPMFFPTFRSTTEALKTALVTLVSAMMASFAGMVMLSRYLPRMPLLRRLVPANPTPSQVLVEDAYSGGARVGDIGHTEGSLRPAGKARFGSVLVDVVTQGEFLAAHTLVEIIEHRGNRVVVREARN